MNPQDVKTNADRLRVRDEYLAVLRQQEANLQKTANAMNVMAQTGQPPIAPSDMRSSTEKLADIERLKPMFRKQLMSLMDGKEVEVVMNELDNVEIQSASVIFGEIYNELKGKYPLGVPSPIFVEFLRRFLRDYNKSIGFLPKSKEERDAMAYSPPDAVDTTTNYIRYSQRQIEQELEDSSLAKEMREQQSRSIVDENNRQGQYNQAFSIASPSEILETAINITGKQNPPPRALALAKRVLGFDKLTPNEIFKYTNPSKGEIISYLEYDYFRNFGEKFSPAERSDLGTRDMNELQDLFINARGGNNIWGAEELVEDIPQEPIQNLMFDMLGEVERRATRSEVESSMESMLSQVEAGYDTSTFGANPTVAEITEAMRRGRGGRKPKYASKEEARLAKLQQTRESKKRSKLRLAESRRLSEIPAYSGAAEFQGLEAVIAEKPSPSKGKKTPKEPSKPASIEVPEYMKMSFEQFNNLEELDKIDYMDRFSRTDFFETIEPSLQKFIKTAIARHDNPKPDMSKEEAIAVLEDAFRAIRQTNIKNVIGFGLMGNVVKSMRTGAAKHTKNLIVGRGLKGKKDFADKIDTSVSTLPENKSYVPFGKYVLNQRRLNDNKLMIRTIRGGAVTGIPTLAISPVLGGIIKKMVGGALPSYNEMSKLSEEDQNTLYKIFKMSEVDNADLLPAPNKSKEEEEMNRFQILKGQVLAGNDNKELIKEFKVMLLKFIHNGKVPRGQGMDIICDLMAMGY